jgi:hypothetical protein
MERAQQDPLFYVLKIAEDVSDIKVIELLKIKFK